MIVKPFLWSFIKNIQKNPKYSGGQEQKSTESLAEENNTTFVEIIYDRR